MRFFSSLTRPCDGRAREALGWSGEKGGIRLRFKCFGLQCSTWFRTGQTNLTSWALIKVVEVAVLSSWIGQGRCAAMVTDRAATAMLAETGYTEALTGEPVGQKVLLEPRDVKVLRA